jgi:hypothetical protein
MSFVLRTLLLTVLFGASFAAQLPAQAPAKGLRVSIAPAVGYLGTSPLLEHDPWILRTNPDGAQRHLRLLSRLSVEHTLVAGAEITLDFGQRWAVTGQAAFGASDFEYHEEHGTYLAGEFYGGRRSWLKSDARVSTFGVSLGRQFALPVKGAVGELVDCNWLFVDMDPALGVAIGPEERPAVSIMKSDVAHDLATQVRG